MTWAVYTTGAYPRIVVGMISIGLLGDALAALLRAVEQRVLAWSDRHTQT
jgi:ABC-type nitrate/sulfonate/bicarbonate transport system permease component